MRMLVAGEWVSAATEISVHNPFDNSIVDTVPRARAADVDRALAFAARGAETMRRMPGYERYLRLKKAAEIMEAILSEDAP